MNKKSYHKFFHIDVNSAYLSWEASYRIQQGSSLDLREIPSVVGGDEKQRRGIVLAKSIPAKAFDIRTGEPIRSALEKCPNLTIVPPNYDRYLTASNALYDLMKNYSPYIQRFSVDEMFIDYKGVLDPKEYADIIREDVRKTLGFTVNIGIGDNKLLAKVASDFKKPDMTHTLYKEEIPYKLWPLPVGELFMVGSRTKAKLESRGIDTIGQLAKLNPEYIYNWLKKPGLLIWEYANGIENSKITNTSSPVKSIGNSTTIPFDIDNKEEAFKVILALSEMVGLRLRAVGKKAWIVSVSIKYKDFSSHSKQRKLFTPISSSQSIFNESKKLFLELWTGAPIRHLGVRVQDLVDEDTQQLSFFNKETFPESLDNTIDSIRYKYGLRSIQRSVFLNSGIPPVIGGTQEDLDYPVMTSRLE